MTSKIGVFVLSAAGLFCALVGACGEGQISGTPRTSDGNSLDVDEQTPGEIDFDAPAPGVTGVPYGHVTPADIGVSIGPGVVAAYPTIAYSGSCTVTTPGTTIENRIINCSTLNIRANNVTVRNSVLNLNSANWGIKVGDGGGSTATGFTLEYSHVDVPNGAAKVLISWNGNGNGDYRNMTIRNNHYQGGHDFFYTEGRLDGFLLENNVMGPLACADTADTHSDGLQIGEGAPTSGNMTIRGNYWDPQKLCWKTAMVFATSGSGATGILVENNYMTTWGDKTIWCADPDSCVVRYNVYDAVFESQIGNRCGGSQCDSPARPACCGYPSNAVNFGAGVTGSYSCNRYQSDGGFIEQRWVSGVTHSISGCPSYTP